MTQQHSVTDADVEEEDSVSRTTVVDEDPLIDQRPRRRSSTAAPTTITTPPPTPPIDATSLRAQLQQAQKDRDRWKFLSRKNETRFRSLATALDEQGISARQLLKNMSHPSKYDSILGSETVSNER